MSTRTTTCFVIIIGIICLSLSSNPPQGKSGAPFDGSCNQFGCHFGSGFLMGELQLKGIPEIAIRGQSYNFSVQLIATSGSPIRGGFQMVAVGGDTMDSGLLSDPGNNSTLSNFNNRTYFEHQPAKLFNNADTIEYSATWTAPTNFLNYDTTTFYISSILANGSNNPTGDTYIRTNFTTRLKIDSSFIKDCDEELFLNSPQEDVIPGSFLSVQTNERVISTQIVEAKGNLSITSNSSFEVNDRFEVAKNGALQVHIDTCQSQ